MNLEYVIKNKINTKPYLSESNLFRYFSFSILYLAQGIPEGIIFYALPAWLAFNGKTPLEISSYVGIIGLPWSFKIIAAPIMDRITYLPMGRKRPWVLIGQFGLIVSFFSMALIENPLENLFWLAGLGFMVSLSGVLQDIAVDGLAVDILPIDQQARANGLMWGSKTIGTSSSVALGAWILNEYSFFAAISTFSIIILLIILVPMFLRERPGEKLFPWTKGAVSEVSANLQLHSWKIIFKSLFKVFFLPVSFIMGVGVFSASIGRGLIDTLLPIFTVQELNWTNTQYSQVFSTANLISGLAGMFIGGALVDFFGKIRMITIYLSLLIILIVTMSFFTNLWENSNFVIGFIIAFYVLITFYTIAVFATAMRLCWKKIAATQFTLYMAISNLGLALGAALVGPLKEFFEWQYIILAYVLFALVMIIMIRFVDFESNQNRIQDLAKRMSNDK
jgi:PAT family beta-lactamase induction signal transducer AmpG